MSDFGGDGHSQRRARSAHAKRGSVDFEVAAKKGHWNHRLARARFDHELRSKPGGKLIANFANRDASRFAAAGGFHISKPQIVRPQILMGLSAGSIGKRPGARRP
jgi:hypothetical protein